MTTTPAEDVIVLDTARLIPRETPRNQARIEHWRKVLREQGGMPPIEIMAAGKAYNGQPRYLLWDGHHRIAAAKAEGALCVAAVVVTRS
jgi:hypothetical protein